MIAIRTEEAGDAPAIHAVHAASFDTTGEADLVDMLRLGKHLAISLVAEDEAEIIGHVAFSPVTVERGAGGIGLGPVAVLAAHRRHGTGAQLIRAGLTACRSAGFAWVVVLGNPAYYARFGFLPAAESGLHDEYGGGNAFQVLELLPGALSTAAGPVQYSPEFATLA